MGECIEREVAIKKLDHFQSHLHTVEGIGAIGVAKTLINEIPAADVRPVVRGKWVVSRTDYGWNGAEFPTHCKCTECGREVPYQDKDNFCPSCGAMMEES